jgi:predicted nucleic acid-binding protein
MSDTYVFDAEAIIAYLYNEPGHDAVASILEAVFAGDAAGYLTETNASEVYYLVARFEGTDDDNPTSVSLRVADRDLRALEHRGLGICRADWRSAGQVKADGGLSLADAHAVALAHDRDATLVAGGDSEFDSLPVEIDVHRFRPHGV